MNTRAILPCRAIGCNHTINKLMSSIEFVVGLITQLNGTSSYAGRVTGRLGALSTIDRELSTVSKAGFIAA